MTQMTEMTGILSALSTQMADAVARAGRALVQVDGRPRRPSSGTVYAPDLVVVADHAIERDDDLAVHVPDGRTLGARLAGRDPASDLAVLRVAELGLEAATPAAGPARVGQFALAVGRPGGGEPMASIGIVSAVGGPLRSFRGGVLEAFIQTDAVPYPGFSGGPLIDAGGAVLGIMTSGLARGVGLVVPVDLAWRVAGTLAREGYVKRGYLGVGSQPVRIPVAQRAADGPERGLLIVEVAEDSPAQRGGVLLGDLLVAFDGHPVSEAEDLQGLLVGERVGRTAVVEVIRGGARTVLALTVGQRNGRSR